MKTVLVLRHGKSDWGNPDLADIERPLTKRGLEDAPRMGALLEPLECVPDLILSSPALRAMQTAELVAKACGYTDSIRCEDAFYGGGSQDLLAALRRLPDSVQCPLLIGHNPTLEETVTTLINREGEAYPAKQAIRIPTAGLVCLDFDVEAWPDLGPGDGVLRWFLIPRLVRAIS